MEKNKLIDDFDKALGKLMRLRMRHNRPKPLKPIEMGLLIQLEESEGQNLTELTPSQLSERMEVAPPAISPAIQVLEEKGFLLRRTSKSDRRKVYLSLTEAGREAAVRHRRRRQEHLGRLIEYLGREDTARLVDLIERIGAYYQCQADSGKEDYTR